MNQSKDRSYKRMNSSAESRSSQEKKRSNKRIGGAISSPKSKFFKTKSEMHSDHYQSKILLKDDPFFFDHEDDAHNINGDQRKNSLLLTRKPKSIANKFDEAPIMENPELKIVKVKRVGDKYESDSDEESKSKEDIFRSSCTSSSGESVTDIRVQPQVEPPQKPLSRLSKQFNQFKSKFGKKDTNTSYAATLINLGADAIPKMPTFSSRLSSIKLPIAFNPRLKRKSMAVSPTIAFGAPVINIK